MSSSPIDGAGAAAEPSRADAAARRRTPVEIRQRRWIKRVLPRTMFGRSLLHHRDAAGAGADDRDLGLLRPALGDRVVPALGRRRRRYRLIIDAMQPAPPTPTRARLLRRARRRMTELDFTFAPRRDLAAGAASRAAARSKSSSRQAMSRARRPAVRRSTADAIRSDPDRGPARRRRAADRRCRASGCTRSTTYIFILWMVGSSLVLLAVATVFMRNQVQVAAPPRRRRRRVRQGPPVPFFKLEGALEVRQAAVAFIKMRDRIQRQIRQRTEMLAGVSHDLRTPLTRMKLALELIGDDASRRRAQIRCRRDGAHGPRLSRFRPRRRHRDPVETDIALLIEDLAAAARRDGRRCRSHGPTSWCCRCGRTRCGAASAT